MAKPVKFVVWELIMPCKFFFFFFTFNHRMEVCSARLVKQFTALNMAISLKMVLWMSLTRKEAFQAMLTVEWSQLYMTSAVEYRYYYYYLFFIIIILPLLICDCLFIWSFLVTVCINLLIEFQFSIIIVILGNITIAWNAGKCRWPRCFNPLTTMSG